MGPHLRCANAFNENVLFSFDFLKTVISLRANNVSKGTDENWFRKSGIAMIDGLMTSDSDDETAFNKIEDRILDLQI